MKRLMYPVLLGLALAGCAQQQEKLAAEAPLETTANEAPAAETGADTPTAAATPAAETPPTAEATPAGQLHRKAPGRAVVYHGEMRLRVENFEQTTDRLDHLLTEHSAILVAAHETRADGQHRQELQLQVKPEQFLPLVSALGKLGHIDNKDISALDATADLLAARDSAAAQQAAAQRLQRAAQAATGARAAELQADARQRRATAEDTQARLRALGLKTAWATLTVHLYQPLAAEELEEPLPAYGPRFAAAFLRGGGFFLDVLVAFTHIWPLALLTGLSLWGLRTWRQRHEQANGPTPRA